MKLYTITIEIIDGGTYVQQIYSENENTVLVDWSKKMELNSEIEEMDFSKLSILLNDDIYDVVKIENSINVWSNFITINEKSLLINIILTCPLV